MFSFEHLDALRMAELDKVVPLLPPGGRVLEIGAGTGRQALELQRRGFQVTAIDIASSDYVAHRLFPIVDYDGQRIPLPAASVDVVFSSNVLEHVPNLACLQSEIHRVLAPGGYCIHVLPTHGWRFWTTLAGYPDALAYLWTALPELLPRALPRGAELRRLGQAWYRTARAVGGRMLPRRHGERGSFISEMWLFHPQWWRRHFREQGFVVVHDQPMGLFYTGNMLLGSRLGFPQRQQLAATLGSACHLFQLAPASNTLR